MWLYPLPALLAFAGYVYTVVMRPKSLQSIWLAVLVAAVGTILFFLRSRERAAA
jgi:hypothetical protein